MSTHPIAFSAMLFTLAACATGVAPSETATASVETKLEADARRGAPVSRLCFARNISGFSEASKTSVVVREGLDHFQIETFGNCSDLKRAQSLAIDSMSSCLSRGDSIVPIQSAFGVVNSGIAPMRCRVRNIFAWSPEADDTASDETLPETEES